jgi:hypothetical protein
MRMKEMKERLERSMEEEKIKLEEKKVTKTKR